MLLKKSCRFVLTFLSRQFHAYDFDNRPGIISAIILNRVCSRIDSWNFKNLFNLLQVLLSHTFFARTGGFLNSRSLCVASSDLSESTCTLTPGHFFIGSSTLSAPEWPLLEDVTPSERWARVRRLFYSFFGDQSLWTLYIRGLSQLAQWRKRNFHTWTLDGCFELTNRPHWVQALRVWKSHPSGYCTNSKWVVFSTVKVTCAFSGGLWMNLVHSFRFASCFFHSVLVPTRFRFCTFRKQFRVSEILDIFLRGRLCLGQFH